MGSAQSAHTGISKNNALTIVACFFYAPQWSTRVQTFSTVNHTCQQVRHSFGRAWYLSGYLFWCPGLYELESGFRGWRSCLMHFYVLHLGQYLPDIKIQCSLCSKWSYHVTCTLRCVIIFQFDDMFAAKWEIEWNWPRRFDIAKMKFSSTRLLILQFICF